MHNGISRLIILYKINNIIRCSPALRREVREKIILILKIALACVSRTKNWRKKQR